MPALLTVKSVDVTAPDGTLLLSGFSHAFGPERCGIVGRNGSGKSSLLRVLAGEASPRRGSVERTGSVGFLRQSTPEGAASVVEAFGVAEGFACLDRLEQGRGTPADAAAADWTLETRVGAALARVGLGGLSRRHPVQALSGGERTRLGLSRLLLEAPDLLLLDEPTNNLDAEGRALVADIVRGWPGGVVVASHDRALLEAMDRIVEIAATGVTVFGGGWSAFAEARAARRARAAAELDRAEARHRQAGREAQERRERQARRDGRGRAGRREGGAPKVLLDFRKGRAERTAGRGNGLGARRIEAAAAELDRARAGVETVAPLRIDAAGAEVPGARTLVELREVVVMRGPRRALGPLTLTVRGPERLAVTGPNGAGKTTLLNVVAGLEPPASGEVRRAVKVAMLDQHAALLREDETLIDAMRRLNPRLSTNDGFAALARFGFRNAAATRAVGSLSGGERLRVALACVLSQAVPPQLLLLDEPTNHMDLDSIEVLEEALRDFPAR